MRRPRGFCSGKKGGGPYNEDRKRRKDKDPRSTAEQTSVKKLELPYNLTKGAAAIRTLESKGWRWKGGDYFVPPLGQPPQWILEGFASPTAYLQSVVKKMQEEMVELGKRLGALGKAAADTRPDASGGAWANGLAIPTPKPRQPNAVAKEMGRPYRSSHAASKAGTLIQKATEWAKNHGLPKVPKGRTGHYAWTAEEVDQFVELITRQRGESVEILRRWADE